MFGWAKAALTLHSDSTDNGRLLLLLYFSESAVVLRRFSTITIGECRGGKTSVFPPWTIERLMR